MSFHAGRVVGAAGKNMFMACGKLADSIDRAHMADHSKPEEFAAHMKNRSEALGEAHKVAQDLLNVLGVIERLLAADHEVHNLPADSKF